MVNNSDLPAEFALVAACCRWPVDTVFVRSVAEESQSATDWQRVLRIAARHRVSGLVGHGLRTAGIAPPEPVAAALARAEKRIALQAIRAAAESHRLKQALTADGIDALVVKGATLDRLGYDGAPVKEARDIDLLIAPDAFAAASRTLARAGYERLSPAPALAEADAAAWMARCKESAWLHKGQGHLVELHIALADSETLLPGVGLGSPRQTVALGKGLKVATLADRELIAYLFVHGATHGWARLKWLADVNALLARRSPAAVTDAYRGALDCGAGRAAGQGLLLCHRLLGLAVDERLRGALESDKRTAFMVAVALNLLAGRYVETELDDSRFGTVPLHLSHFLIQRGIGPKLGLLAQKLRTPFGADEAGAPGLARRALSVPRWLWRRAFRRHLTERAR